MENKVYKVIGKHGGKDIVRVVIANTKKEARAKAIAEFKMVVTSIDLFKSGE